MIHSSGGRFSEFDLVIPCSLIVLLFSIPVRASGAFVHDESHFDIPRNLENIFNSKPDRLKVSVAIETGKTIFSCSFECNGSVL
jgi:hypothetical protein